MSGPKASRVALAGLLALALVLVAGVAGRAPSTAVGARNQARGVPYLAGENGGEADRSGRFGPDMEQYENRAYPRGAIGNAQVTAVRQAMQSIASLSADRPGFLNGATWTELGPRTPIVPAEVTYTGRQTMNSGRITALAINPNCVPGNCRLWVGAAGGGVWRTGDALAQTPNWAAKSDGLGTNAIGSLAVDPNDPSGNTIYVGTGEPNGSGDSEAGLGLYKSTNGGDTWTLVPGSVAAAEDRSIGSIAIDPTNASHYYIGTDVARHGSASVNGGRRTPPGAPTLGVYETTNGGQTFTLIFSQAPNPAPPGSGVDWFQGGVNRMELDPNDPDTLYAALFGYGIWRQSPSLDGDSDFHQVFGTMNPADTFGDRTEFDLVSYNGTTRIYTGDSSDDLVVSVLWRTDDANVPAGQLFNGTNNVGWTSLSSATNGTPGFGSYNYCHAQCGYDSFVASPDGHPDEVWLGGAMNYPEIFSPPRRSNGRAVVRSTDAGVNFTDMTNDSRVPALGMHPDQHAIVFDPNNAGIAFVGSDGGLIRTSGQFVDISSQCADRKLRDPADVTDCENWLSSVPKKLYTLNENLGTIQFQSLSVNPFDPTGDIMGGTQDNGTWQYSGSPVWIESVGGDGGQSGVNAENPLVRMHTYFSASPDVNFHGSDVSGWDKTTDPLIRSLELSSFYVPLIPDPVVGDSWFIGLQHVWRTQDNGGNQAFLDANCNYFTGLNRNAFCGDWQPIGGLVGQGEGDLTSTFYGNDRVGHYVVATSRAPGDEGTLWAATRIGRVFVSKNADIATARNVTYSRIDTPTTPGRFVSGIAIDPADANHAWVSYSGYNAYTPATKGHVFDVHFNPATGTATWDRMDFNLGDQPITGIVFDDVTGDLYVSTDFTVYRLPAGGSSWILAAPGLPLTATYGLTIAPEARVLYAATHGRGAWSLSLP
jgi:hypothetical protein